MAELATEHIYTQFITRKVEHQTFADNDGKNREHLMDELVLAFIGKNKPVTA